MILNTPQGVFYMRAAGAVAVSIVIAFASASAQQKPRTASPPPAGSSAQDLASGWNALASGRLTEAEAIAERMLQAGTRKHDAMSLQIAARVQARRPDAALDRYEQWLQTAGQEDIFLLQPVAAGILQVQADSTDIGVRVAALQALAEAGDKTAPARLAKVAASREVPGIADEALARIGNPEAVARLTRRVAAPNVRTDVSGDIDALVKGKAPGAATAIAAALDPARTMPTKMSAARALGELGSADAIPQLQRALQDPEPPVRMMAAAALARLGDQSGAELIRQMENSPVTDIRLMAAQASASANPSGPWTAVATAALQDADPIARLTAAQMLVAHGSDPAAALATLNEALADPNPALRLIAARAVEDMPRQLLGTGIPRLRGLLRDQDPRVRITAAGALLRLAGGID
jgi:HEAT repeat protein